ncbi:MAG TPA: zf-TFIIB domain-containing protein [Myxococcota bacterium]|nr:zf-TFIIB domain-containing protein [Myxococcota bacterium]
MAGTTDEAFFEGEIERLRKLALEQGQRIGESERERLRELHWLRCAKCGMQMETVMYAGLQMERCFHCGGTYMDQPELEKVARESSPLVHGLVARLQGPEARTESGTWTLGDGRIDTPRTMSDGFGDFEAASLLPSPVRRDEESAGWAALALVALLLLVGVLYFVLFQRPSVDRVLGGAPKVAVVPALAPIAPAPAPTTPAPAAMAGAAPAPAASPAAAAAPPPAVAAVPPDKPAPAPSPSPTPTAPPSAPPVAVATPVPTPAPAAAKPVVPATPAVAKPAPPAKPAAASYDSLITRGRQHLLKGRASQAMAAYESAHKKKPGSVEALTGMGWAYVNLREPHVGVVKFRQALSRNARYGDAYIGLGKAFRMMGKPADAKRAYGKYLELHPKGPSANIATSAIASLSR